MGKLKIFEHGCKKAIAIMNNAQISPDGYYERCKEVALSPSVTEAMERIARYCESHPTCKGCKYHKEHIGCIFRGKSPREWKINEN